MNNKEVGKRVAVLRKKAGMSQEDFSKQLGVSRNMLSKYENGDTKIGLDQLIKLRDIFGVSIDSLLTGDAENITAAGRDFIESLKDILDLMLTNQAFYTEVVTLYERMSSAGKK